MDQVAYFVRISGIRMLIEIKLIVLNGALRVSGPLVRVPGEIDRLSEYAAIRKS
jgi:hypothetical protein